MEGIRKTGRQWKRWTDEAEEGLKIMGVKNQYTVVKRQEEFGEECVGNQGPEETAVAEVEQEVEQEKKNKNKTITQRETAMSITIV